MQSQHTKGAHLHGQVPHPLPWPLWQTLIKTAHVHSAVIFFLRHPINLCGTVRASPDLNQLTTKKINLFRAIFWVVLLGLPELAQASLANCREPRAVSVGEPGLSSRWPHPGLRPAAASGQTLGMHSPSFYVLHIGQCPKQATWPSAEALRKPPRPCLSKAAISSAGMFSCAPPYEWV